MKKHAKKKGLSLSLAMMALLSLPVAVTADEGRAEHGGLFGSKAPTTHVGKGMFDGSNRSGSGINNQTFGASNGNAIGNQTFGVGNGNSIGNQTFGDNDNGNSITNQTFGAPLGGGIVLLLGAGLGYAALRNRRKD